MAAPINQPQNQQITQNFSNADIAKMNDIKGAISSFSQNYDQLPANDKPKSLPHKISNNIIIELRRDFIDVRAGLSESEQKDPKKKELSLGELKSYYKASYKKMQQQVKLLQALETDKSLNPNEQEATKALAKAVELTMKRINDKFVQNQMKMEKELERIRQIEEHEEKKKQKEGKSVGKFAVEQIDKALGGLYDILFEPWSKKDREEAIDKNKEKDIKLPQKPLSKEHEPEKSKAKQNLNEASLSDLGNFSAPKVPNLKAGIQKESISMDYYNRH